MYANRDSARAGASSDLVVSFGEMLIDFVPTVAGVSLAEATGSAQANVFIAAARLGGHCTFVGKLGDDEFCMLNSGDRTTLAFVTLLHI